MGDGAHVRYAAIQDWGAGVTHLGVQRARVGPRRRVPDARRSASAPTSPGPRPRSSWPSRAGSASSSGCSSPTASSTSTTARSRTTWRRTARSDLLYKGALRDQSRAVYSGWVYVRPGAQKTDAMQTSRNIVLSEHAKADAIPNLEIEANDVKCGHAASVGPGRRRDDLLPAEPRDPARRGRAPDRERVLPGGARPRADRRGARGRRGRDRRASSTRGVR